MKTATRRSPRRLFDKAVAVLLCALLATGAGLPTSAWAAEDNTASSADNIYQAADGAADLYPEAGAVDIAAAWSSEEALELMEPGLYTLSEDVSATHALRVSAAEGETIALDMAGHSASVASADRAAVDLSGTRGTVVIFDSRASEEGKASIAYTGNGVDDSVFAVAGDFPTDAHPTVEIRDIALSAVLATVSSESEKETFDAAALFLSTHEVGARGSSDEKEATEPRIDVTVENCSFNAELRNLTADDLGEIGTDKRLAEEFGEARLTEERTGAAFGLYSTAPTVRLAGELSFDLVSASGICALRTTVENALEFAEELIIDGGASVWVADNSEGTVVGSLLEVAGADPDLLLVDAMGGDRAVAVEDGQLVLREWQHEEARADASQPEVSDEPDVSTCEEEPAELHSAPQSDEATVSDDAPIWESVENVFAGFVSLFGGVSLLADDATSADGTVTVRVHTNLPRTENYEAEDLILLTATGAPGETVFLEPAKKDDGGNVNGLTVSAAKAITGYIRDTSKSTLYNQKLYMDVYSKNSRPFFQKVGDGLYRPVSYAYRVKGSTGTNANTEQSITSVAATTKLSSYYFKVDIPRDASGTIDLYWLWAEKRWAADVNQPVEGVIQTPVKTVEFTDGTCKNDLAAWSLALYEGEVAPQGWAPDSLIDPSGKHEFIGWLADGEGEPLGPSELDAWLEGVTGSHKLEAAWEDIVSDKPMDLAEILKDATAAGKYSVSLDSGTYYLSENVSFKGMLTMGSQTGDYQLYLDGHVLKIDYNPDASGLNAEARRVRIDGGPAPSGEGSESIQRAENSRGTIVFTDGVYLKAATAKGLDIENVDVLSSYENPSSKVQAYGALYVSKPAPVTLRGCTVTHDASMLSSDGCASNGYDTNCLVRGMLVESTGSVRLTDGSIVKAVAPEKVNQPNKYFNAVAIDSYAVKAGLSDGESLVVDGAEVQAVAPCGSAYGVICRPGKAEATCTPLRIEGAGADIVANGNADRLSIGILNAQGDFGKQLFAQDAIVLLNGPLSFSDGTEQGGKKGAYALATEDAPFVADGIGEKPAFEIGAGFQALAPLSVLSGLSYLGGSGLALNATAVSNSMTPCGPSSAAPYANEAGAPIASFSDDVAVADRTACAALLRDTVNKQGSIVYDEKSGNLVVHIEKENRQEAEIYESEEAYKQGKAPVLPADNLEDVLGRLQDGNYALVLKDVAGALEMGSGVAGSRMTVDLGGHAVGPLAVDTAADFELRNGAIEGYDSAAVAKRGEGKLSLSGVEVRSYATNDAVGVKVEDGALSISGGSVEAESAMRAATALSVAEGSVEAAGTALRAVAATQAHGASLAGEATSAVLSSTTVAASGASARGIAVQKGAVASVSGGCIEANGEASRATDATSAVYASAPEGAAPDDTDGTPEEPGDVAGQPRACAITLDGTTLAVGSDEAPHIALSGTPVAIGPDGVAAAGDEGAAIRVAAASRLDGDVFAVCGDADSAKGLFAASAQYANFYRGKGVVAVEGGLAFESRDVARADGTGYPSLLLAVDAANAADGASAVELLEDTSSYPLTFKGDVALDLGGHTVEVPLTSGGSGLTVAPEKAATDDEPAVAASSLKLANGTVRVTAAFAGESAQAAGLAVDMGGTAELDSARVAVECAAPGTLGTAVGILATSAKSVTLENGSRVEAGAPTAAAGAAPSGGAVSAYGISGTLVKGALKVDGTSAVRATATASPEWRSSSLLLNNTATTTEGTYFREASLDEEPLAGKRAEIEEWFDTYAEWDNPSGKTTVNSSDTGDAMGAAGKTAGSGIYHAGPYVLDDGSVLYAYSRPVTGDAAGKAESIKIDSVFVSSPYQTVPQATGISLTAKDGAEAAVSGTVEASAPHGDACAVSAQGGTWAIDGTLAYQTGEGGAWDPALEPLDLAQRYEGELPDTYALEDAKFLNYIDGNQSRYLVGHRSFVGGQVQVGDGAEGISSALARVPEKEPDGTPFEAPAGDELKHTVSFENVRGADGAVVAAPSVRVADGEAVAWEPATAASYGSLVFAGWWDGSKVVSTAKGYEPAKDVTLTAWYVPVAAGERLVKLGVLEGDDAGLYAYPVEVGEEPSFQGARRYMLGIFNTNSYSGTKAAPVKSVDADTGREREAAAWMNGFTLALEPVSQLPEVAEGDGALTYICQFADAGQQTASVNLYYWGNMGRTGYAYGRQSSSGATGNTPTLRVPSDFDINGLAVGQGQGTPVELRNYVTADAGSHTYLRHTFAGWTAKPGRAEALQTAPLPFQYWSAGGTGAVSNVTATYYAIYDTDALPMDVTVSCGEETYSLVLPASATLADVVQGLREQGADPSGVTQWSINGGKGIPTTGLWSSIYLADSCGDLSLSTADPAEELRATCKIEAEGTLGGDGADDEPPAEPEGTVEVALKGLDGSTFKTLQVEAGKKCDLTAMLDGDYPRQDGMMFAGWALGGEQVDLANFSTEEPVTLTAVGVRITASSSSYYGGLDVSKTYLSSADTLGSKTAAAAIAPAAKTAFGIQLGESEEAAGRYTLTLYHGSGTSVKTVNSGFGEIYVTLPVEAAAAGEGLKAYVKKSDGTVVTPACTTETYDGTTSVTFAVTDFSPETGSIVLARKVAAPAPEEPADPDQALADTKAKYAESLDYMFECNFKAADYTEDNWKAVQDALEAGKKAIDAAADAAGAESAYKSAYAAMCAVPKGAGEENNDPADPAKPTSGLTGTKEDSGTGTGGGSSLGTTLGSGLGAKSTGSSGSGSGSSLSGTSGGSLSGASGSGLSGDAADPLTAEISDDGTALSGLSGADSAAPDAQDEGLPGWARALIALGALLAIAAAAAIGIVIWRRRRGAAPEDADAEDEAFMADMGDMVLA